MSRFSFNKIQDKSKDLDNVATKSNQNQEMNQMFKCGNKRKSRQNEDEDSNKKRKLMDGLKLNIRLDKDKNQVVVSSSSNRIKQYLDNRFKNKTLTLDNSWSLAKDGSKSIDNKISLYIKHIVQTVASDIALQKQTFERICLCLTGSISSPFLFPYGSSTSGVSLKESDIDICINNTQFMQNSSKNNVKNIIHTIGNKLKMSGFKDILKLAKAKVPIVKGICPATEIQFDISLNMHTGDSVSRLIRTFVDLDIRVQEVIIFIKYFTKCRNLNDTLAGGLSSYAYSLMVIQYFQHLNILPSLSFLIFNTNQNAKEASRSVEKLNIFELIIGFFRYYNDEYNSRSNISVLNGKIIEKPERHKNSLTFFVEDPLELENGNASRSLDLPTFKKINLEFKRAAHFLEHISSINPESSLSMSKKIRRDENDEKETNIGDNFRSKILIIDNEEIKYTSEYSCLVSLEDDGSVIEKNNKPVLVLPPTSKFSHTFHIQLVGNSCWNSSVLMPVSNNFVTMEEIELPKITMKERSCEITIKGISPNKRGHHFAFFRFFNTDSDTFHGDPLWLEVIVSYDGNSDDRKQRDKNNFENFQKDNFNGKSMEELFKIMLSRV